MNYLQDFGTLRRAVQGREVNDPMSSAGRWDDLQLDLRKPHIPRGRRSPVPSNPKLTINGITVSIKASMLGEVAKALGYQADGAYKHRLVTPKAETYRRRMEEQGKPCQSKLWVEPREVKLRHDNIRSAILSLVNKARFERLPSVAEVYKRNIRILWEHRHR